MKDLNDWEVPALCLIMLLRPGTNDLYRILWKVDYQNKKHKTESHFSKSDQSKADN